VLSRILEGGAQKITEAGAALVGGHSVEDTEPKYGLAVVGEVHTQRFFKNVGARPGDRLVLTKPLGSGIVTTAIKRKQAKPAAVRTVTRTMATLNRAAAEVLGARHRSVHAVTDVTGYGLLGHLLEMLEGSGLGAVVEAAALPILPAALELAEGGVVPGGTRSNLRAAGRKLRLEGDLTSDDPRSLILADAQTSGGLLAAVSARACKGIVEQMEAAGVSAHVIGRVEEGRRQLRFVP
jgi:selenide,water dikinase